MKKILLIILLLTLIFWQSTASCVELPAFLPNYYLPGFEINGQKLTLVNHSVKDDADQYLYFTKDKSLVLLVENIKCDRPRSTAMLNNIIGNLNDRLKSKKGEFIKITKKDIHAQIFDDDRERTGFAYILPNGVQIWTYVMQSSGKYQIAPQYKIIKNFVNKQRYEEALVKGNVSMGFYGSEIYEYAETLLREGKKKEGVEVLEKLIATSPYDYRAHMDFAENSDDPKAATNSSKIVIKGAEDPKLIAKAARFLDTKLMMFESIPFLNRNESGLQVILVPLLPCDLTILEEVSKTYQNMTNIPVKIRRLKESWTLTESDRIPYQRFIQEMLIKMTNEDIKFKGWKKDKYISEMKKAAETKDALDRYYINDLISRVEKQEGQYFADVYLSRFLDIIENYRSNDIRTMYVAVTGINIYSGDNNYIFSLHMIRNKCQASILSYYMMLASNTSEEYESRRRLIDRVAKELVPASLKSLSIPRSSDPACPYSYSSGVDRLDQKTLILSEEVKNKIEEIRLQRINTADRQATPASH